MSIMHGQCTIIGAHGGVGGGTPEVITLSGTSLDPNSVTDPVTDPENSYCYWEWTASGRVSNNETGEAYFQEGIEWSDLQTTPGAGYYIRFTLHDGTAPDAGDALNVWHALATGRTIEWNLTSVGDDSGVVKVEISSDVSGTPVVATGYYGAELEVALPE